MKNYGYEDANKVDNNNIETDIEKSPKILEGKIANKYNFSRSYKKDYNGDKDAIIEKLKNENKYLNKIILKYKTELNVMDISNIKDEIDDSQLTDDKAFEDLLDDLENINNNYNSSNNNVNNIYNIHNNNNNMKIYLGSAKNIHSNKNYTKNLYMLKDSIDSLMTQIKPSQNVRGTLGYILKQLGCSDEEVIKLMDRNNRNDIYRK